MPAHILYASDQLLDRGPIADCLSREGHELTLLADGADVMRMCSADPPDLLVLDSVLPVRDGYQIVRAIRKGEDAATHLPIMLLGADGGVEAKVQALRAGADDYLSTPIDLDEVAARVAGMLLRFEPVKRRRLRGIVHAYYGAKGGVGTSTIAVNSAIALRRNHKSSVALIDANLHFGDHRLFLDVGMNTHSIVDACSGHEIDDEVVRKVMVRHRSGIDLMLAPTRPDEAELVSVDLHQLLQVVEVLRGIYDYVVVDLDKRLDDHTLDVISTANKIFVVMTADLTSIKNVRLLADTLSQLAVPDARMELVLNRSNAATGINQKSAEWVLKRVIKHSIVNDYRTAITSLNTGRPFMLDRPDSAIGKAIARFADTITESGTELASNGAANVKKKSDWLRRGTPFVTDSGMQFVAHEADAAIEASARRFGEAFNDGEQLPLGAGAVQDETAQPEPVAAAEDMAYEPVVPDAWPAADMSPEPVADEAWTAEPVTAEQAEPVAADEAWTAEPVTAEQAEPVVAAEAWTAEPVTAEQAEPVAADEAWTAEPVTAEQAEPVAADEAWTAEPVTAEQAEQAEPVAADEAWTVEPMTAEQTELVVADEAWTVEPVTAEQAEPVVADEAWTAEPMTAEQTELVAAVEAWTAEQAEPVVAAEAWTAEPVTAEPVPAEPVATSSSAEMSGSVIELPRASWRSDRPFGADVQAMQELEVEVNELGVIRYPWAVAAAAAAGAPFNEAGAPLDDAEPEPEPHPTVAAIPSVPATVPSNEAFHDSGVAMAPLTNGTPPGTTEPVTPTASPVLLFADVIRELAATPRASVIVETDDREADARSLDAVIEREARIAQAEIAQKVGRWIAHGNRPGRNNDSPADTYLERPAPGPEVVFPQLSHFVRSTPTDSRKYDF